jgi:hypothetical protein
MGSRPIERRGAERKKFATRFPLQSKSARGMSPLAQTRRRRAPKIPALQRPPGRFRDFAGLRTALQQLACQLFEV